MSHPGNPKAQKPAFDPSFDLLLSTRAKTRALRVSDVTAVTQPIATPYVAAEVSAPESAAPEIRSAKLERKEKKKEKKDRVVDLDIDGKGYLRLSQVLTLIPVSRSTFYAYVLEGTYPKPVRIGKRTVAWRASDIARLLESFND